MLRTSWSSIAQNVRMNAFVNHVVFATQASLNWLPTSLHSPWVQYIVSWGLSPSIWTYSDSVPPCIIFLLHIDIQTRYQYGCCISDNPSFCLKYPGVPDGSDGSDGTSYRPDWELHASRRPGNGSRCILTSTMMRPVYTSSEQHVCYTLRRGCSYSAAVHTTPGDVYVLLWPIATLYLSVIAIYRMPHSPHICLALRFWDILQ
jgi:hypothetical protein